MITKRIIYCYPNDSTFVEKDIQMLSNSFTVVRDSGNWLAKQKIPLLLIKQFFFYLKQIRKTDQVFVMFAGYWSIVPVFIAKLFRKPCFIILGGTDCVTYPELNYGSLRKLSLKKAIGYSVKNCYKLLPVAKELMKHENTYFEALIKKQGLQNIFPKLKTPFTEIPNGFNIPSISNVNMREKNSFVSIAIVRDKTRYVLKGFDKIKKLAESLPGQSFTLIGVSKEMEEFFFGQLKNVTCFPFLKHEDLNILLLKSEFYLQLSISEGHPNSLCEAMSHACIPIVSSVTSMPRIVGDSGFVLEKRDDDLLLDLIGKCLELTDEEKNDLKNKARNRIIKNYDISLRREKLEKLMS